MKWVKLEKKNSIKKQVKQYLYTIRLYKLSIMIEQTYKTVQIHHIERLHTDRHIIPRGWHERSPTPRNNLYPLRSRL